MDFSPLSERDIEEMLKLIGVQKIDDLFFDIPKEIKNPDLKMDEGLSELNTMRHLKDLARKNMSFDSFFCGAGIYNHYIPPVVSQLISRSEFYTSYTPYQAEISQGFLQAIFEYQTSICNLTGMDVSNASVYDGATAITESLIMARNITRKKKFLIVQPINPQYRRVIDTYAFANDFSVEYVSLGDLESKIDPKQIGAVVLQNPNFLGNLLNIEGICETIKIKSPKTLIIYATAEASSLGILKRPGSFKVDIVCGEGQSFGLPMNFGGPTIGFIATTKKYLRKIPGRIVGKTKELHGEKEGYILTLQAREQHIRREKALSNICSNEALCMLAVQIYLAAMGYSGLRNVALTNVKNTAFLRENINSIDGYSVQNNSDPIFNEFLVCGKTGIYKRIKELCLLNNVCPPYYFNDVDKALITEGTKMEFDENKDYFLVCNTEMNTKDDIQGFIQILKEAVNQ